MSLLKPVYRYSNYILIVVALLAFYMAGIWDADLGDYTKQINQLSNTGSLVAYGKLNNRYPPATSLIYFTAFKLFGFAGRGVTILLLHTIFALLIQHGFELLLKHLGYNASTFFKKTATCIVIFNPFILSFIVRGVNSELIFICCSLYAVWFALRANSNYVHILLAGIITGIAILTRMQGVALVLSLCLLLLLTCKKTLQSAVFLFAVLITIGPWQYMNTKYRSGFIASGGLPSFRDGLSFNNKKYRQPIELPHNVSVLSDSFYHIYYALKEGANIEPKQDEISFVKDHLQNNPGTAVELVLIKLKRSFYGTDSQSHKIELLNKLLIGGILLALFASAFVLTRTRDRQYNLLLAWLCIYSTLTVGMSIMVLSILRYQAPLLPFWFLTCFIAIEKLQKDKRPHLKRRKAPFNGLEASHSPIK